MGLDGRGCGVRTGNVKQAGLSSLARTPEMSFLFIIPICMSIHVAVCLGLSVEGE